MAENNDARPIIIVKKVKKSHGGHHGGAWKVAYADFVTAMMAFFMVMWIIGMDQSVKSAIEGYFQNPEGFLEGKASTSNLISMGNAQRAAGALIPSRLVYRRMEDQLLRQLGEKIETTLKSEDGLAEIAAQVEVVMTNEGLRIELVEGDQGDLFFDFGSADMKPAAAQAVAIITSELKSTENAVVLEGHTDAAAFTSRAGYSNWELSADRANSARRVMERSGLQAGRVAGVRGYADQHPRVDDPYDQSNRRISILLPYSTSPGETIERAPVSMPDPVTPVQNAS